MLKIPIQDPIQKDQKINEKNLFWSEIKEQQVKLSFKKSQFDIAQQAKMILQDKYMVSFNFFLSKPINQIVYELTSCKSTQAFMDLRILAHEGEFLKRSYKLITQQGNQQIYDRLRMLGDFYNMDDKRWKSQYPTMIITDTKSIFERRNRRLKKIKADQGSSDETEQKSQYYCYSFDTSNFLQDLGRIQDFSYNQENKINNVSLDSQIHNVYIDENEDSQNFDQLEIQFNALYDSQKKDNILKAQVNIDHLLCDFQDQSVISHVKDKIKNQFQKKNSLIEVNSFNQKKHELDSYQKNQLNDQFISKDSKHKQGRKKSSIIDCYLDSITNRNKANSFNKESPKSNLINENTLEQQKKKENLLYDMSIVDKFIEKQRQEKLKNRKKIRQKAQQLLRKVRGSIQIY